MCLLAIVCSRRALNLQVELLFDSTCDRIRAAAAGKKIPLPDALMPCGMPLQAMYHVNFSGEHASAVIILHFDSCQRLSIDRHLVQLLLHSILRPCPPGWPC